MQQLENSRWNWKFRNVTFSVNFVFEFIDAVEKTTGKY